MNQRTFRLTALSFTTAAALLGAAVATPAHAQNVGEQLASQAPTRGDVFTATDGLARQIGRALADQALRDRLVASAIKGPVDLMGVETNATIEQAVLRANQAVLRAKGLPMTDLSLLQLRLAHPDMAAALARGEAPLVAAVPTDDTVTTAIGYDRRGAGVVLDVAQIPNRPVLVVEVDVAKALPVGLEVMRDTLAGRGITHATKDITTTAGYWATKVRSVRLSNDQEPWIKGAAEIFNLVGGFGLDGKVKIDTVQMPYLDNDGTTYYPNQLIVHYNAYKYNLADVVMMEDDGDTNYLALAQAIATALLYIVDGGAYTPLVNAILAALPASWWTDDPDYVDSWYTLATWSSGRLNGAAANGWMDVAPYWVEQF